MYDPEEKEYERDDFFDAPPPEEKPKEPKAPTFRPDQREYWEQEESEWEHLQPTRRHWRLYAWLAAAAAVVAILIAVYVHWFVPSTREAIAYGYIEQISYNGVAFKTFEGTLLPYREMMDTTRVYREDFRFSVDDEEIAKFLKRQEKKGHPVRLTYEVYKGIVPWRGATKVMVTAAEAADPMRILPPEFRPEYVPRIAQDSVQTINSK